MRPRCSLSGLVRAPFRLVGSIGAGIGALGRPPVPDRPTEARASIEQLLVVHERTNELLGLLATLLDRRAAEVLHAGAPDAPDDVLGRLDGLAADQEAMQTLLAELLVGQQRTNDLLELALRAAFDDDERPQGR